jgi:hypothetical protein
MNTRTHDRRLQNCVENKAYRICCSLSWKVLFDALVHYIRIDMYAADIIIRKDHAGPAGHRISIVAANLYYQNGLFLTFRASHPTQHDVDVCIFFISPLLVLLLS